MSLRISDTKNLCKTWMYIAVWGIMDAPDRRACPLWFSHFERKQLHVIKGFSRFTDSPIRAQPFLVCAWERAVQMLTNAMFFWRWNCGPHHGHLVEIFPACQRWDNLQVSGVSEPWCKTHGSCSVEWDYCTVPTPQNVSDVRGMSCEFDMALARLSSPETKNWRRTLVYDLVVQKFERCRWIQRKIQIR